MEGWKTRRCARPLRTVLFIMQLYILTTEVTRNRGGEMKRGGEGMGGEEEEGKRGRGEERGEGV